MTSVELGEIVERPLQHLVDCLREKMDIDLSSCIKCKFHEGVKSDYIECSWNEDEEPEGWKDEE